MCPHTQTHNIPSSLVFCVCFSGEMTDPFAVGGRDLDPLGQGVGGMYMDPRRFGFPSPYPDGGHPRLPR